MYTIIMNEDKSLTASVKTTLFQREKLADKIQFLFPKKYGSVHIGECVAVLKYVDQGNVAHSEILVKDDELYKNRVRYVMPVDTNLTRFAGDIELRITFLKINTDTEVYETVLHTGAVTITISPLSDYYQFVSDTSLEIIDQKLIELEAKLEAVDQMAESYEDTKADNLIVEENKLSLTANGNKIGDSVNIGVPAIDDGDVDGDYNGVVELDDLTYLERPDSDDVTPDDDDFDNDDEYEDDEEINPISTFEANYEKEPEFLEL